MRKIGITVAMVLWVISAARIVRAGTAGDSNVISAFNSMDYASVESRIDAYGRYGNSEMDEEQRKSLVMNFASSIGADGTGTVTVTETEDRTVTEYRKNADNADTVVKLISIHENHGLYTSCDQYVSVSLTLTSIRTAQKDSCLRI